MDGMLSHSCKEGNEVPGWNDSMELWKNPGRSPESIGQNKISERMETTVLSDSERATAQLKLNHSEQDGGHETKKGKRI